YIFPAEEDAGIMPLEAQACGTPVIAYKKGGVLETVIEGQTGIFFDNQSADDIKKAVLAFRLENFNRDFIRQHAQKFDKKIFQAMKEDGIDISQNKMTQLTPELVNQADQVVYLADKLAAPDYLLDNDKVIMRPFEDPYDSDYGHVLKVRDGLKALAADLLKQF